MTHSLTSVVGSCCARLAPRTYFGPAPRMRSLLRAARCKVTRNSQKPWLERGTHLIGPGRYLQKHSDTLHGRDQEPASQSRQPPLAALPFVENVFIGSGKNPISFFCNRPIAQAPSRRQVGLSLVSGRGKGAPTKTAEVRSCLSSRLRA